VYKNPWRPCQHCQAHHVRLPCYKLLGPNTESKLEPSRPPPTPYDAVIEPEEVLLLDYLYTEKILETGFLRRLLYSLKFFAQDSVFGPSIRCRTLRYAMLAVAEVSVDCSVLASPRFFSYVQKSLRALPRNSETSNIGDLLGIILLLASRSVVGPLRDSVTFAFRSQLFEAAEFHQQDQLRDTLSVLLSALWPAHFRASCRWCPVPATWICAEADLTPYSELLDYRRFKQSYRTVFPTLQYFSKSVFFEYIHDAAFKMSRMLCRNAEIEANGAKWHNLWRVWMTSFQRSFNSEEFRLSLSTLDSQMFGDALLLVNVSYCQLLLQLLGGPTTLVETYSTSETITACRNIIRSVNLSRFTRAEFAAYWGMPYIDLLFTRLACLAGLGIPRRDFVGETSGASPPPPTASSP
jgi:hypothetical protein